MAIIAQVRRVIAAKEMAMDFRLSDEHQMIQQTMRRIALERIAPRAAAIDENHEYPEDIYQVFKETGMLGVAIPEEYEGAGAGTLGLAIAVEEASKFCQASALILLLTKLSTASIMYYGTEEQKRKYLVGTATGQLRGAFGLTEPGTGSDSANIRTTARKDGDSYILNGTKHWISGATVADFFVVATKTDPTAGNKGFSVFIVDRDTPGFSVGKQERKMGVRGVPTAELIMQDARVPAKNMIGAENKGFKVIMGNLNSVRPVVAARGVGMAEGALQYAVNYAKQRETFGKPIIEHQAINFMLAETAMRAEASRLLTYQASWMVDQGQFGKEAAPFLSMAKAFATETAVKASDDCLQVLGSYGYSMEYPMERFYRDAKQLMIVEGTSQIQRMIIGKALIDGDLSWY